MTILRLIHKVVLYALYFLVAAPFSIFCIVTAPLVVYLFVDKDGYLPKWLKWYEPVDTERGCWDRMWAEEHPDWSFNKICYTFIQRNPAYGLLDSMSCKPSLSYTYYGNLDINDLKGVKGWFFILGKEGQWQLRFIYPIPFTKSCIQGDWGWQLKAVMHKTYCNLQLAPVRFYGFGVER